jgi:hypothetical protein
MISLTLLIGPCSISKEIGSIVSNSIAFLGIAVLKLTRVETQSLLLAIEVYY